MIRGICYHCHKPVAIEYKNWHPEQGYTDERLMIFGPDEHWWNATCPHCGEIVSTTIRRHEHSISKAKVG